MRIVIDSNVLVSAALFSDSIPNKALNQAIKKGEIIISEQTLDELKVTLSKPKLKKYLSVKDKLSFIYKFEVQVIMVSIKHKISLCRDPKDNMYLELALSGNAEYIITGDNDLLQLNPFKNIPIITPKEFLDRNSDN